MKVDDIMFSVHEYDIDGEVTDNGIFLHFGETRVKVATDLHEFQQVIDRIASMKQEISDNYAEFLDE